MLTPLLRIGRQSLRHAKPLRKGLAAVGLVAAAKRTYQRRIVQRGQMTATLMGQRLRFTVASKREIKRIESFESEAAFVGKMLGCLRPGDVVWDVGANIGVISLLLAKSAEVTVHAFEPEPRNFAHLQKNILLNSLQNRVFAHRLALGNRESQVGLHVGGDVGQGNHSIIGPVQSTTGTVDVDMVTGAQAAREIATSPSVVKIDVEGAEMEVLCGVGSLLSEQRVRTVFVEVHPHRLAALGYKAGTVAETMRRFGYLQNGSASRDGELHQTFEATSLPDPEDADACRSAIP